MSSILSAVVRLSVTLVDQDHIGWKSWKLITRTISPTPSLFVAQENMGKFWGDYRWGGKKWSTKVVISLKRVHIEEWRKRCYVWPIGTHQRSFERYHPNRLRPPLPQDWGSQPPPKTSITIISGTGKATDFKFRRKGRVGYRAKKTLQFPDKSWGVRALNKLLRKLRHRYDSEK